MKHYVFDSSALISYLDGEPNADKVAFLLKEININDFPSFLSVVNMGEVYYHFLRTGGDEAANKALWAINTLPIEIINADVQLTLIAAKYKAFNKISYADAYAAALAEHKKAVLVTGDKEFEQVGKNVKIEWI